MIEFRKRYWYQVALCASFLPLIYSPIAYTADVGENLIANVGGADVNVEKDTYTVNFNNISIIEFIRFASKITNLNFLFEETDLQFTVTVVSEEAVSAKGVMAALAQVLRVHDLMIVEQDGNVLITASKTVNQIPTIISADLPNSQAGNSVLVTRVFRIKNANVNTVAGIIRPMVSAGALIEVSAETRQLIVTDITTSIDQIASLLTSIDAPHTPLDVETYVVKNIAPHDLIALTEQIIKPFSEGNPLIFVPQTDTNSIFVVSTPYLIERAMTVMEDLDLPPKSVIVSKQGMVGKSVFLYKPLHRSAEQLLSELTQISSQMKGTGGSASPLQMALDNVQEIQDSNSLMFVADAETTTKIKDILASIDTPGPSAEVQGQSTILIYKPQYVSADQIQNALQTLLPSIEKTKTIGDQNLAQAIQSLQWHPETQSFIVSTDQVTADRLKTLLTNIDSQQQVTGNLARGFFLYKLESAQCDKVLDELHNVTSRLSSTSLQNQNLISAVKKIECIKSTNSLLITGTNDAIDQVKALIAEFDTPSGSAAVGGAFLIYKAKYLPAEDIQAALNDLAADLQAAGLNDPSLLRTLSSMRYVAATKSLVFTGDQETLDKVQA